MIRSRLVRAWQRVTRRGLGVRASVNADALVVPAHGHPPRRNLDAFAGLVTAEPVDDVRECDAGDTGLSDVSDQADEADQPWLPLASTALLAAAQRTT